MDKSNKKDEMRAAGKKRLEEFRMKRQHKAGPVKAAENKDSADDQISLPVAVEVDTETEPVNYNVKLPSIQGTSGVEEQESTIDDVIDAELAKIGSQQDAELEESPKQSLDEEINTKDSSVSQMETEKKMLAEQLAVVKSLLEQRDTEYCARETQLLADALAATKLSDEVKAHYANELDNLTAQLGICHTENNQLSKQLSASRDQLLKYGEEVAQQGNRGVDLEKQVQALLEEKRLRESKFATIEERLRKEEKSNNLLSSSLQHSKEELLESRNRESILLVQLDSARTELSSVQKEKGQVLLEFEATSSMVRSIEQQKLQLESALQKEMQEKTSLVAAKDGYVLQLIEHAERSGELAKENEHQAYEVLFLQSKIQSMEGDKEVGDSAFQQQILQLTQDYDKLSQEADLLRGQLSNSSNKAIFLQKEVESVKKELEEVVNVKRHLSDELVSAKDYVQAALEENRKISAEVDALRNSSEFQLNENIQLKADSKSLTSELCRARQVSAECEKELPLCQQSLAEVLKVRGQLEDSLQKLSLESEEWQRENTKLLSEVDKLHANLVSVSAEKSDAFDHLQAEMEQLLTENRKLHEELLELNTKLEISVGDVKTAEAEKVSLLTEVELLKLTMKEITEQRDSLSGSVVQLQQVNDELKEETYTLQNLVETARNGWQDVIHSKSEQDVEVEQLKKELQLSSETLQQHVEAIKVLEQEKDLLNMHISIAESTSLELEQAVRQVLPSESPEVGRSSKSADSGVHLASCVRKLIHEFEARANHSGHDLQVQASVLEHESSLRDGSVDLLEPLSHPKELENLQSFEGDVLSNFEQIKVSDLQALHSQLRETCEEISRLDDVSLSKSQEIVNVTEQLSKLKEENQAVIENYEGQVSQLLCNNSVLEGELASSEKKCEEQGHIIQCHLETCNKVHSSLTALKERLYFELGEAPYTGNLQEQGANNWSEVESLVDTCYDMLKSFFDRNSDLQQQMEHLALEKDDLQKLVESVQDQITTLHLEKATAVKLNSEMVTELSDVRGRIQQLETREARNQSLLKEYETEQVSFRQLVASVLEMFNSSCHNILVGTGDVAQMGQEDGTAPLFNQLEERCKDFVDFSTLQMQEKMKLIAELQGKVDILEDSLSRARVEVDEIRSDLKLLAEKVEMPSLCLQDCSWDDSAVLTTDVAGNLALNIGMLIRVFKGELQNKVADLMQLQVGKQQSDELVQELRDSNEKLLCQVDAASEKEREVCRGLEQKLAAAKDKLALAVSRGKAVGHQRDVLKQSLAEKAQEQNLQVATYVQQLKEKDVSLESTKQDLRDVEDRASIAEQELARVKESLFTVEQQLLGCTTTFEELETVMKEIPVPDDVNTKGLAAGITFLVRSFGGIQQELAAAVKELDNLKDSAALSEIQLKNARDKETILIGELEVDRQNLNQQWSSEVEKCMQAQALLFEEASHNAAAKDVLLSELDLTTEKLAVEVQLRHKLQADFEAMVENAQCMVPNSVKAELSSLSFPSSFNAVTSSLLALYKDTCSEVKVLKEKVRELKMPFEQAKAVDDELTHSKRQVTNLQQVAAEKDLEISGFTTRMEEAASTMAHQEEEIRGMSQQLHRLKHNLDEALNEKRTLQAELTDMEHRLATTREKLGMAVRKGKALKLEHDTLKHSLGGKVAETEAQANSYAREMQSKDSLLQELRVKLSAVVDEKQVLHEEKVAAISQLANETSGTRSIMEETTALRARTLQQERELESLKNTLSAHATELNRALLTASQFSTQVTDLQVTNSDLSEELAVLKLEMLRLRQENGEAGSLKACTTSAVESMNFSIEALERLQVNLAASTGTPLESTSRVSNGVNDIQGDSQQGFVFTEDFVQRICQRLVRRVQYFATWSKQMVVDKAALVAEHQEEAKKGTANLRLLTSQVSSLKQQLLLKDREAEELSEERDNLQVAIQDIQTLSKKALEEKESTIGQMKYRLAQLEGTVKDLVGTQDVNAAKVKALETRKVEYEHQAELLHSKFQNIRQRADKDANSLEQSQGELATMRELLSAKNEDLEAHMQALFEAESQVDSLSHRVRELEVALRQKHASLQSLESSRSKAIVKLNTNYQKLNEVLHQSEGLLALSENLQLDLEKRDGEILRLSEQLAGFQSQESSNNQESNVNLDTLKAKMLSMLLKACNGSMPPSTNERTGEVSSEHSMLSDLESLESLLENLLLEVEALKSTASKKDNQLQDLRIELQVLSAEKVSLQGALQSQQMQLQSVVAEAGSTYVSRDANPLGEIDGMGQRSKRALGLQVSNVAPPHVRGTRKVPMSDVVLDVDLDQPLHDVEDKGHDYKSLAMAKFMPRVMRPAAERLDGFWRQIAYEAAFSPFRIDNLLDLYPFVDYISTYTVAWQEILTFRLLTPNRNIYVAGVG